MDETKFGWQQIKGMFMTSTFGMDDCAKFSLAHQNKHCAICSPVQCIKSISGNVFGIQFVVGLLYFFFLLPKDHKNQSREADFDRLLCTFLAKELWRSVK